ncbi:hypothetical protein NQ318_020570 [Aromia moschata]|uniref:Uncharacterized protein n=1 Tax=Aromia moschata TaxID=1265417 RepID=A0AAV8Z1P7_9CUCU|nr:hypothetical protein NQ318_020570 [Aromia moschata]
MPLEQEKSPKSAEQNENNINIERNLETIPVGIDEVDETRKQAPQVKKREKRPEGTPEREETFERSSLHGSGIKRDKDGIPQEIPTHMLNAATKTTPRLLREKGKAPSPPEEGKTKDNSVKPNFDEIQLLDENASCSKLNKTDDSMENLELEMQSNEEVKDYNSDSDVETDNQSSVNTIELNPSEITIHQTEDEERQNRRTASTGDLSKMQRTHKISTGTLERAQSLDITDTGIPSLSKKRKGGRLEDAYDMQSDEDLFGNVLISKEPRLSLILDGLNTFQRNRLKKSTEWGNLEDAILKLNQEDESITSVEEHRSLDSIQFHIGEKSPEFDALVNKIKEIKRESLEIEAPVQIVKTDSEKNEKKVKNQIWPTFETEQIQTSNGSVHVFQGNKEGKTDVEFNERKWTEPTSTYEKRQQIPMAAERILRPPSPTEEIISEVVTDKIPPRTEDVTSSVLVTQSAPADKRQMKPSTFYDLPTPEYREDAKIAFSKIDLTPNKVPERVNHRQRVPDDSFVTPLPAVEKIGNVPEPDVKLKEDWNISVAENIMNTSPPPSLEIDEELVEDSVKVEEVRPKPAAHSSTTVVNRSEEVLSKIPLLNSMVKSQKEEAMKKPVLSTNSTDETKTVVTYKTRPFQPNLLDVTQNFLYTEQLNSGQDDYAYSLKPYDTNISDDIKVSRHTHEGLERQKSDVVPISDDAKSEDSMRHISNINVTNVANGDSELHSLELSINEPSELYTTALDTTVTTEREVKGNSKVTISTPDLIKNVTLAEAITTVNNDVTVGKSPGDVAVDKSTDSDGSKGNSTLTYITEIQVTPNSSANSNISEIEIISNVQTDSDKRNLDSEFENYVKSFESKLEHFENIRDFDKNIEEFMEEEPKSILINEKVDEKELHKIQEIAEEQLKKLPEMRFTTASYESSSRIPEKRNSQIELLRSNFEKAPPKPNKPDVPIKSRIPIATTTKTPPMSPERRDSRNLDMENDKAILELMSSSVTSTPYTTSKYQIKPPSKNVTVTSIRSNSKIPSGLPTLSSGRPPIAPRKVESSDGNVVQVSTNGNYESSFKQWVFNPSNVTNVVVTESKQDKS